MNRPAEQLSLPGVVPDSKRSQGRRRRWTWIAITAVALGVAALLLAHMGQDASGQHQPPAPRPAAVVAAPAVARDLRINPTGLGPLAPPPTVTARTPVC